MLDLLAFKATDVPAINKIKNGDFSKGVDGWYSGLGALTSQDNELIVTVDKPGGSGSFVANEDGIEIPLYKDHAYYVSMEVKPLHPTHTSFFLGDTWGNPYYPRANVFNKISDVISPRSDNQGNYASRRRFRHSTDSGYSVGDKVIFKNMILVNLTETFGKGNEPTKEQMDMLLEQFPNSWFDGTKNLFNAKDFMSNYLKSSNELTDKHTVRELPNGTIDEFDFSNNRFVKRVSDDIPLSSFLSSQSMIFYASHTDDYVVARLDFNGSLLSDGAHFDFIRVGGLLHDKKEGSYRNKGALLDILEHEGGGEMSSNGGNRFIYFTISLENYDYSLDSAGVRDYVLDNDMRITYQLKTPIYINLPPNITVNTRELTRLSGKIKDLENAVITLGGSL